MEDAVFHEYPMDCFAYTFDQLELQSSNLSESPECYSSSYPYFNFPDENLDQLVALPPPKKHRAPPSQLISFGHSNAAKSLNSVVVVSPQVDFAPLLSQGPHKARKPAQAQEHVLAERKRREKLSQRFVALSAMLPGLKKMDKASILGDAIKYVKQLEERLRTLEEQAAKKTVESAVLVKRSVVSFHVHHDDSSSTPLPEIQARVSGKDVLIRIHCHKHSGREAPAILTQLEKHHLTVHTTTSLPFGNNTLDITIVAQMKQEYCMTPKDLLGSLRLALTQFS